MFYISCDGRDLLSQLRLLGFLPLVLEDAGSRVAVTRAGATKAARTVTKCILNGQVGFLLRKVFESWGYIGVLGLDQAASPDRRLKQVGTCHLRMFAGQFHCSLAKTQTCFMFELETHARTGRCRG